MFNSKRFKIKKIMNWIIIFNKILTKLISVKNLKSQQN